MISAEMIVDYELSLCDAQPSAIGGLMNEFIFSGRLDNLMCSYCALEALLRSTQNLNELKDGNIRMIALFDNEECGSESAHGAHVNNHDSLATPHTLNTLNASKR